MTDKFDVLKKYFGYNTFRSGQEEIIESILNGKDVLAVMPTGAGKSICYQVPAVIFDGITLVISPLISLMKDQVGALNQNGIRAAFLNSSLTSRQYSLALQNIKNGVYKIIYVAPERLMTQSFLELVKCLDISLVAVDEAHCVSEWGHDFRTSYTEIIDFISMLKVRPVVAAFTATATELVKSDIRSLLGLKSPYELTTGFDRPNLYFAVEEAASRLEYIRFYLDENQDKSGIIYVMTRKSTEDIYNKLLSAGYPVTYYHAGLTDEQRTFNQDEFIKDKKPIIVATNAFGMGIDKPDVQFIIHYNMPLSMEEYYQEAGRAGRDGSEADCILLFSASDIYTAKFLIENSDVDDEQMTIAERAAAKSRRLAKLEKMISYCRTTDCLRSYILNYFGENTDKKGVCKKCSSCLDNTEDFDATDIVKAVREAIYVTGERYGTMFIADFLHGNDNGRMGALGFTTERCWGLLSGVPVSTIRDVISRMIEYGYLLRSEGQYPILSISPELNGFVNSDKRFLIKIKNKDTKKKVSSSYKSEVLPARANKQIYEALKKFRRETADKRSVPAYVILTDSTIRDISVYKPTNMLELLNIKGIGTEKAERYGSTIIGIVKRLK